METLTHLIEYFGLQPFGVKGTKFTLNIGNDLVVFVHLLNDKETIRISVSEEKDFINAVDLVESKDEETISNFISTMIENKPWTTIRY